MYDNFDFNFPEVENEPIVNFFRRNHFRKILL